MSPLGNPPQRLSGVPGATIGCGVLPVAAVHSALWLAWTPKGLSHALWTDEHAQRPSELAVSVPEQSIPAEYERPLRAYFNGEAVDPISLPVDLTGTPFQREVWQALLTIPRGQVRSYAAVAASIGNPRGMRAVGMANASNPVAVVVPCHRVVEKDMGLGGYSGGLHIKRFLLSLEGVDVAADQVRAGQLPLI